MAHVNLCEVMPGSSGTLTGAIVVVPGCSSDAISLLLGRAGANGPRQPRTDYVFKNCPVYVESTQKDLITSSPMNPDGLDPYCPPWFGPLCPPMAWTPMAPDVLDQYSPSKRTNALDSYKKHHALVKCIRLLPRETNLHGDNELHLFDVC